MRHSTRTAVRSAAACAALAAAACFGNSAHAGSVYDPINNVTYTLDSTGRTWVDANNAAIAAGQNLARVRSASANEAIRAVGGNAWIGATDQATEGDWRWTVGNTPFWNGLANGTAVGGAYTNWNGGEPNDAGGEDYAQMTTGGGWNDLPSTSTLPSVREVAGNQASAIFNNKRYTIIAGGTWNEARQQAIAMGGNLAHIDDANEDTFLATLLSGVNGVSAWIGANDEAVEGDWRWTDNNQLFWQGLAAGAPVNGAYTAWNPGEPNDVNGEDYAELLSTGAWNDLPAAFTRLGIVEQAVPEPTGLALLGLLAAAPLARRNRRA